MSKTWSGIYLLGTATVVTVLVAIAGCTKTTTLPPPIGTVNPPPGAGGAALVVTDTHSKGSGAAAVFLPTDAGTTAPQTTITGGNTGLHEVKSVARDSRGNIYLGDNFGGDNNLAIGGAGSEFTCDPSPTASPGSAHGTLAQGQIVIFDRTAAGNALPAAVIGGTTNTTLDDSINGIAVDGSFNIWVSQDDSTGDMCPNGDPISNGLHSARIMEFSGVGVSGDIAPTAWIQGSNTELNEPNQLTFDASGKLWTADGDDVTVKAYNVSGLGPGDNEPLPAVEIQSASFFEPTGVAFDPSGNLYVADVGASKIFRFTAAQVSGCGSTCTLVPNHIITPGGGASGNVAQVATDGVTLWVTTQTTRPYVEIYFAGANGVTTPVLLYDSSNSLFEANGISL